MLCSVNAATSSPLAIGAATLAARLRDRTCVFHGIAVSIDGKWNLLVSIAPGLLAL
jgi:hypothetical protein